jgi:hypothetical protein
MPARRITQGMTYTAGEQADGDVALVIPGDRPEPRWPGEPWDWPSGVHPDAPPEAERFRRGDFPRGYRETDDGPDA